MAKIRLTADLRQALRTKAVEFVRLPTYEATEARTRSYVYAALDEYTIKKFPAHDMDLLDKYKVAMRYVVSYGDHVFLKDGRKCEFPYTSNTKSKYHNAPGLEPYTTPRVPRTERYGYCSFDMQHSVRFVTLWDDWCAAADLYGGEYKRILDEYIRLIENARTLEEIESVWPEASTVREHSKRNLPALVLDSTISAIQRHRELMAAQTKKTKRKANPEG